MTAISTMLAAVLPDGVHRGHDDVGAPGDEADSPRRLQLHEGQPIPGRLLSRALRPGPGERGIVPLAIEGFAVQGGKAAAFSRA